MAIPIDDWPELKVGDLASLRKLMSDTTSSWDKGLQLNFEFLEREGTPPEFLHTWKNGWELMERIEPALEFSNHPSVADVAERCYRERLRLAELGKVQLFEPGAQKPELLHVSPSAAVITDKAGADPDAAWEDRTKLRLILDLKRGGVNRDAKHLDVNFASADKAVALMSQYDWLYVIDFADFFYNWKVCEDTAWKLGFYDAFSNRYGRYLYAVFGLTCSPGASDASLKVILANLKRSTGITLVDWVDDLIGSANSEQLAWNDLVTSIKYFLKCGMPVSIKPAGLKAPAQIQTWTGWTFNTIQMDITVPPEKISKALSRIEDTFEADSAGRLKVKALAKAIGILNHIAEIFLQGRRWLRGCWTSINETEVQALWATKPWANPSVSLSLEAKEELRWWRTQLRHGSPRRPMFYGNAGNLSLWIPKGVDTIAFLEDAAKDPEVWVYESDASASFGWGYTDCQTQEVCGGRWPPFLRGMVDTRSKLTRPSTSARKEKVKDINFKELWCVCNVLVPREAPLWARRRILVRIDNKTAVSYVNKRRGKIPQLASLAARLDHFEKKFGCAIVATHIRGKANVIADSASRDPLFPQVWKDDDTHNLILKDSVFSEIQRSIGSVFTIDAWADRLGKFSKVLRAWCSPAQTAFQEKFLGEVVYAFPPKCLTVAWLEHLVTETEVKDSVTIIFFDPSFMAPKVQRLLSHFRVIKRYNKDFAGLLVNEKQRSRKKSSIYRCEFPVVILGFPKILRNS